MFDFGTGIMGVLAVPFLQFLCIPLGVVGATQLWHDLSNLKVNREENDSRTTSIPAQDEITR